MNGILVVSVLTVSALFSLSTAAQIDSKCLECICKVESGCKALGCHMDVGSLSCGYYQIKKPYYIDCGQPGKRGGESTDTAWKRCASDKSCATSCVIAYTKRYGPRCSSNPTCQTYARVHNGGPNGCKNSGTVGYWNKVNACYRSG